MVLVPCPAFLMAAALPAWAENSKRGKMAIDPSMLTKPRIRVIFSRTVFLNDSSALSLIIDKERAQTMAVIERDIGRPIRPILPDNQGQAGGRARVPGEV